MTYSLTVNEPPDPDDRFYPQGYLPARTALLVDTMCDRCGAMVGDHHRHDAWHNSNDKEDS